MNSKVKAIALEMAKAETDGDWVLLRSLLHVVYQQPVDVTISEKELSDLMSIKAQRASQARYVFVHTQLANQTRNEELRAIVLP